MLHKFHLPLTVSVSVIADEQVMCSGFLEQFCREELQIWVDSSRQETSFPPVTMLSHCYDENINFLFLEKMTFNVMCSKHKGNMVFVFRLEAEQEETKRP